MRAGRPYWPLVRPLAEGADMPLTEEEEDELKRLQLAKLRREEAELRGRQEAVAQRRERLKRLRQRGSVAGEKVRGIPDAVGNWVCEAPEPEEGCLRLGCALFGFSSLVTVAVMGGKFIFNWLTD